MTKKVFMIRSGGQTGSDRAALDIAKTLNIPICGWCPKGGWAEDFETPPGLMQRYPELKETPSSDVAQRTIWNVRDSHATLIILPHALSPLPGTMLTVKTAQDYKRPFITADEEKADDILMWFDTLGNELILNVAGPRESEVPGIYEKSRQILYKLLTSI